MVSKSKGKSKNRPTVRMLTPDDGMPSDFIQIRISNSQRCPGKILAYYHMMLGWLKPSEAFVIKLIAENAHKVIDKGYEVNRMIVDLIIPSGGAIVGAVTSIADVALFLSIKDYADGIYRANRTKTTPEREYAKLLVIMALPYGMVYIVGIGAYNLAAKDWEKIVFGEGGFPGEQIKPGEPSDDPLTAVLNFLFGLLGPWDPLHLPRI